VASATEESPWYETSLSYWERASADMCGMLGGLEELHAADVAGSLQLIDQLRATDGAVLPRDGVALDCGSGIGRVSASVLLARFAAVELVEPIARFLETARRQLPVGRVHKLHETALQDFTPQTAATSAYAVVWMQWVLNYLKDEDLTILLRRCAAALLATGRVVIKESVSREGKGFYVDRSDASITRTDSHFRRIFATAGLKVVHAEMQSGLPRAVFPVCMYVLQLEQQPAASGVKRPLDAN